MKRLSFLLFNLFILVILGWAVTGTTAHEDPILDTINEFGTARVLVELFVPAPTAATYQTQAATMAYQGSIDTAQNAVFSNLPIDDGVTLRRVYENFPAFSADVDAAGLRALRQARYVISVSEVGASKPHLTGTIPLIGADTAHDLGYTGQGVAVAILDTGLDVNHPFFAGTTGSIIEACFNTYNPFGFIFGRCPDPNIVVGYGPGSSCADGDCHHGTHVAGIAAGDNRPTMTGVAPDADIIAINVFSRVIGASQCDGEPECLLAFDDDIVEGLDYVIQLRNAGVNIVAVNMSLGSGRHTSPCTRLDSKFGVLRYVLGIMPIASTGNESYTDAMGWPACRTQVVSVGNTTDSDQVAGGSNVAYFMDFFAPGTDVASSVAAGNPFYPYANMSGTSMAAPHVTGAFAVMRQANPSMSIEQIYRLLQATGVPVTDQREGGTVTAPRIDLGAALQTSANLPQCNGHTATIYVINGVIFGGPDNGQTYTGLLRGTSALDVMVGTEGPDRMLGYSTNDIMCGLGGDDVIYGHEGQDDIWGGAGNDVIYAGVSGDDVWGGEGDDTIELDEGTDHAYGGAGDDHIEGGTGQDYILGEAGSDVLIGDQGDDYINGGDGDDWIWGLDNNDRLYGEDGFDQMWGGGGDDQLYGGDDHDDLLGGENNDWLYGQGGDGDWLLGGPGDDRLSGGDGVDDRCRGDEGPHDYSDDTCEIRETEH